MNQNSDPLEKPTAVIFLRARHREPHGPDQEQEQRMIAWQRAVCEQTSQKLNAQVIREYVEYGGTGSMDTRPVVRLMLDELHARHDTTYLIVARMDRLARQAHDWTRISSEIRTAGAELVTAATPADTRIAELLISCNEISYPF